jgi:hypothetical protein
VARKILFPRKQRTRQHVIADQSVNYVERFVIDEGHTVQRLEYDYGYDLHMITYDEDGYVEPGSIYIQLKASERLVESAAGYIFDLDIRDYNLWMMEPMPVILILFDASRRRAFWLHIQRYFQEIAPRRPRKGAQTVRLHVSRRQPVNRRAIARMRAAKQEVLEARSGGEHA